MTGASRHETEIFYINAKKKNRTEKEAFSLPKFIIERSRAIEIVFLVLVLISALMRHLSRSTMI